MRENELFTQQVNRILDEADDEFVEVFEFANYFKVHSTDQRFLLLPHSVSGQYVEALNILKEKPRMPIDISLIRKLKKYLMIF